MKHADEMTIYALASAHGRAGVSVVRISGALAGFILKTLSQKPLPNPHHARVRDLFSYSKQSPKNEKLIDHALVLWMPGPDSFTGEDVVELHVHGGIAIQNALFHSLASFDGVRMAEAGEFTKRAFEHHKLDLTQAEGLNDLIWAETEAQREQALKQMQGSLGQLYESWRQRLLKAQAFFEANIDFSDEDIPESLAVIARPEVKKILDEINIHLDDKGQGQQIRQGFQVVIIGAPNVGKSSLINKLANEDIAIVSNIAGTTRDSISVRLDLGGYPVTITDTAGIRESDDLIEKEGVRRALKKANEAQLCLYMLDVTQMNNADSLPKTMQVDGFMGEMILVFNKCDQDNILLNGDVSDDGLSIYSISALTGMGIEDLVEGVKNRVVAKMSIGDMPSLTRQRHRKNLEHCVLSLQKLMDNESDDSALQAEDLRMAIRSLGKITGRVDVEDMLDIVFGEFCIGK